MLPKGSYRDLIKKLSPERLSEMKSVNCGIMMLVFSSFQIKKNLWEKLSFITESRRIRKLRIDAILTFQMRC